MRRERRFGQPLPPKPVELGKEYDVDIEEISRRGQGIARIQGFVIFVPDTKPNDRVRVKITRISQRFAEAEVVRKAGERDRVAYREAEER
ncbi:MAG: TRAM domain-containing protein [Candidatus Bathyarchaeia archaeon]